MYAADVPHLALGACMEVHRFLGPGHGKQAYVECLARELVMREILHRRNVPLTFDYKGSQIKSDVTVDFLIEDALAIEVYADTEWPAYHKERMASFLQLMLCPTGFLINFHEKDLRKGVKRLMLGQQEA